MNPGQIACAATSGRVNYHYCKAVGVVDMKTVLRGGGDGERRSSGLDSLAADSWNSLNF